jgi:hypothetical protein
MTHPERGESALSITATNWCSARSSKSYWRYENGGTRSKGYFDEAVDAGRRIQSSAACLQAKRVGPEVAPEESIFIDKITADCPASRGNIVQKRTSKCPLRSDLSNSSFVRRVNFFPGTPCGGMGRRCGATSLRRPSSRRTSLSPWGKIVLVFASRARGVFGSRTVS